MHLSPGNFSGYNREDLLRYISGQMPAAEMHSLEKAAMEDPFLADALEGMQQEKASQVKTDLETLEHKLSYRVDPKVVRMPFRPNWWRAAIVASFLSMMGLSYYLFIKKDDQEPVIAQNSIAENMDSVQEKVDLTTSAKVTPGSLGIVERADSVQKERAQQEKQIVEKAESQGFAKADNKTPETINPAPAVTNTGAKKLQEVEASRSSQLLAVQEENLQNKERIPEKMTKSKAQNQGLSEKGINLFYFTGQVTDMQHKPVAYANIAIQQSQRSYYTDANGNFRIVGADSSLQVYIKSVGFQSRTVRLGLSQTMHQVMLQPSPASLKKKKVAEIAEPESEKDDKADLEKPDVEPRDGFGAYQFYILNNIRIPAEARNNRINGQVELSFLVNENGRLSDFKIEKSLCQSCDKEAIRLIKEGPPWILYNSDAPIRTRMTIVF